MPDRKFPSGTNRKKAFRPRTFARPAGTILDELVRHFPFKERLREYGVLLVWDEVVGPHIRRHSQPTRIEDGKLFVRVSGSTWMQELQLLTEELRERLNERLGGPIVREIFLMQGRLAPERKKSEPLPRHDVDENRVKAIVPDGASIEVTAALRRIARARLRRLGD